MKTYSTSEIRNIVLMGAAKSGKTTLAEAMLYEGKVIPRRGSVEEGNTVSDNTPFERENQKSVNATPLYAEFMGHKFNVIDAPGADDFCGGAISAFKVVESAVLVVNAANGVEVGTQIFARYADRYGMPVIVAVNQLDHDKASWEATLAGLGETFGKKPVVCQFPVDPGAGFSAFVDVITMRLYHFKDENGTREDLDIPEQWAEKAAALRAELMEQAAEGSDTLMEKYFAADSLTTDEIRAGLGEALRSGVIMPVFCLSGKRDIGVKRLMEFLINVAPAPDTKGQEDKDGGVVPCKSDGPASLFIYKVTQEPHLGEVAHFKVVSGKVSEGMDLVNAESGASERLGAVYAVAGEKKEKVDALCAGDIGCVMKLKGAKANVTLTVPGGKAISHLLLPQPKYFCAIKAVDKNQDAALGEALSKIAAQDASLQVSYAQQLHQTLLYGMGEQHIHHVQWMLENERKIRTECFAPKVPYRETITTVAAAQYRHKKQTGGAGQFGEVHLLVCPYVEGEDTPRTFKVDGKEVTFNIKSKETIDLEWGGKLEFCNCIVGGAIDQGFMPAILKGIRAKMEQGPLTGSCARDIRVYVYDGKMHPVDSKEIAFIIAGRNAFRDAFRAAGPKILEPIYEVAVTTPGEFVGACMGDLNTRRGVILDQGMEKGFTVLRARVPLAELCRYSTALSALTGGSATFTMAFADYQRVPADVQARLTSAYSANDEE